MKKVELAFFILLMMALFISCSDDDDNTNGATIQNNGFQKTLTILYRIAF